MDIVNQFIPNHGRDLGLSPVSGRVVNYSSGYQVPVHCHPTAQLIYAAQGVMVVNTQSGQWVVPPTRGVWIPPGVSHQIRMIGEVKLRTLYFRPELVRDLPDQCHVVSISSLLRELILAAVEIPSPYEAESREGRIMRLLLDEVAILPILPLQLPYPVSPDLLTICRRLVERPDDMSTLADWAERLGVHAKTIGRRLLRETGLTFGQWRQQARLITALELLANGRKVVDVALSLGYSSPSAFATMFRQQFGVSPSAYFRAGAGDARAGTMQEA